MKQTFYHRGGLKPGTYFLIGEHNKVKNGNLMFERIIGDFLVAKGLATTEDNCIYTLDCCSDFTIEYDDETGQLCLTIGEEQNCVTITGVGGTVAVQNALTGTGAIGDPVEWGGNLVKNTTVEGNEDYSVTMQNLTQFLVTVLGASAGGTLRVAGLQSLPAFLRHRNVANTEWMTIDLDYNDTSSFGFQNATDIYAFRVFPLTQELAIRTPGIVNGTANVGDVFTLTDANEGIGEWQPGGGSASIPGPYEDDADAAANGVLLTKPYYVSDANPYGLAEGAVKVRIS